MKALELLKDYRNIDFGCNMEGLHNEIDEAIKELEELKNRSCSTCDTCGKEVDYMPLHYSTEKERHLHSCDECWVSIKDKLTLKE